MLQTLVENVTDIKIGDSVTEKINILPQRDEKYFLAYTTEIQGVVVGIDTGKITTEMRDGFDGLGGHYCYKTFERDFGLVTNELEDGSLIVYRLPEDWEKAHSVEAGASAGWAMDRAMEKINTHIDHLRLNAAFPSVMIERQEW